MVTPGVVSVVVATFNAGEFVDRCLQSIAAQTYPHIETIVVDGFSTDDTVERAEKLGARVFRFGPADALVYGAPERRNYGARQGSGEYVYYVDVDMELTPAVVEACVEQARAGADAVIIPEDSFGDGFWARCKQLERRTYWGDDLVEAPRFVKRSVWDALGGLDTYVGGGGDDWDLHRRLLENGYTVVRVPNLVLHNEGRLTLRRLMRKRYVYGKSVARYIRRHGFVAVRQYSPLRPSYFRHWRTFARDPVHAAGFVVMRASEYAAGAGGLLRSLLRARAAAG